jgi:hypothetical protein
MNRDGSMARGSDLARFCSEYGLTMVTVAQLVRYRIETELDQVPGPQNEKAGYLAAYL